MTAIRRLLNRFRTSPNPACITIVSGLPRSGTSMMMQVLEAGGMTPLTDCERQADDDNPKGYYEFERVKALDRGDTEWLPQAQGKVVKVISALLKHLPPDYRYRVVFVRRNMDEILASQRRMLENRGEPTDSVGDEKMAALFGKHLDEVTTWLDQQPNIEAIHVDYNALLAQPDAQLAELGAFFDGRLEMEAMRRVVDPALYRQRADTDA